MNAFERRTVGWAIALSLVATLPIRAETAEDADGIERFGKLAHLAGSCWLGRFEGAEMRDLHCWEWAHQSRFLRDAHRVMGGPSPYSGETFYGWDAAEERLHFWYFNSLGGVSQGHVVEQDGQLLFHEAYGDAERDAEIRSRIEFRDADSFEMVSEKNAGEGWEPFMKIAFTRFGARPARLDGPWAERWDLVFSSDRDGDYDVYRRDLRTGEEVSLTDGPGTEWAYATGGDLIVVSDRKVGAEPGYRLYRLAPEGGDLAPVNDLPVPDSWLGVHPDGGLVVCMAEAGDRELYLLDADGAVVRQLTDNDADDCNPDVSPDGRTVVFSSDRSGSTELWSMPVEGGEATRLTNFAGNDNTPRHRYGGEGPPRISPDGRTIAWTSMRDGTDFDIYTMAIDGSDVRRLTDHLADDAYPSWSPDGEWIAFDSNRYGTLDLFVMRADGSELTRVTDADGSEQAPLWVPRASSPLP